MKRFALLRFDAATRKTYLVQFINADNAPHAMLQAYDKFGGHRRDMFARRAFGKKDSAHYTTAPRYAGRDPETA